MLVVHSIPPPMVYNVKYDKINETYFLEPECERFEEPEKFYGKLTFYKEHFWNTFSTSRTSMGVMLVGASGSGKSILAEALCNLALYNRYTVIKVTNIKTDIALINFLDTFNKCVMLFDEFAKNFNYSLQDKMLSMFTNSNSKKLFIITENSKSSISDYINNRPGRVRYSIYFGKLAKDVVNEYLVDHPVSDEFRKALFETYDTSSKFSFDHLQAIVSEHLLYPQIPYKDLIELLNLSLFGGDIKLVPVDVIHLETKKKYRVEPTSSINYTDWVESDESRYYWLYFIKDKEDADAPYGSIETSTSFTSKDVIYADDKMIKVNNGLYDITLNLVKD